MTFRTGNFITSPDQTPIISVALKIHPTTYVASLCDLGEIVR